MILIADSGSTKTHWEIVSPENGKHNEVITSGINPFYQSEDAVFSLLKKELSPEISTLPDSVFFYGAGCSQPDKKQRVQGALGKLFPKSIIEVEHDLLAAARATCGNQPGITAILGTGSNSCLFDGNEILDNIPSLGFLLGDEGSAGHFGRKLLQAYYYREMPGEIMTLLVAAYNMDKAFVLNSVYDNIKPNEVVASYAKFLSENNAHPFVQILLQDGFREFIERHILKYHEAKNYPVHFIGSMAFNNQKILKEVMEEKQLITGNFLKGPMQGLIQFHLQV